MIARAAARSSKVALIVDTATSKRMGRIRQHGTKAELQTRAILTELGLRYRTKNRDLPGSPDVANRSGRWAVFVHGCFWHAHANCKRATVPKRNRDFWKAKLRANKSRDLLAIDSLRALGFAVVVIWECELVHPDRVKARLRSKLRRAIT